MHDCAGSDRRRRPGVDSSWVTRDTGVGHSSDIVQASWGVGETRHGDGGADSAGLMVLVCPAPPQGQRRAVTAQGGAVGSGAPPAVARGALLPVDGRHT